MKIVKAIIASLVLFYSLHAFSSTILDGGEIRFRGYVIDDGPKWRWRVASNDKVWNVDVSDSLQKGSALIFNLKNKGVIPFLEGYLNEVAERGGPGLIPYISYSTGEGELKVYEGSDTTNQRFRAGVPVYNPGTGKAVGELIFTVEQGMAVTIGHQFNNTRALYGKYFVSGDSVSIVQPEKLPAGLVSRLSNLLLMNKGFGNEMVSILTSKVIPQGVLTDMTVENIAAAFASVLSDFELHLPLEETPDKWYAKLNVTVTVH